MKPNEEEEEEPKEKRSIGLPSMRKRCCCCSWNDRPTEWKVGKKKSKEGFPLKRDTYIKSSSQKNVFWSDRYSGCRVYLMFWWVRHISLNRLFSSSVCVCVEISEYICAYLPRSLYTFGGIQTCFRLGHRRIAIKSKKKNVSVVSRFIWCDICNRS